MSLMDRRLSRGQLLALSVSLLTAACSPPPLDYAEHTINSRRDEPTGFKDVSLTPITRRSTTQDGLWQLNDAFIDNPDIPWRGRARITILTGNTLQTRPENQIWRGAVLSSAGRFDVGSIQEKPALDLIDAKKIPPEFRDKATFEIRFGVDDLWAESIKSRLLKQQAWASFYLELVDIKNGFQTVPGSRLAFGYNQ